MCGEMFLLSDTESYWYDAIAQGKVKTLELPWSFFYKKYVRDSVRKEFLYDKKAASSIRNHIKRADCDMACGTKGRK